MFFVFVVLFAIVYSISSLVCRSRRPPGRPRRRWRAGCPPPMIIIIIIISIVIIRSVMININIAVNINITIFIITIAIHSHIYTSSGHRLGRQHDVDMATRAAKVLADGGSPHAGAAYIIYK